MSEDTMKTVETATRVASEGGIDLLLILSVVGGLAFCYAAWWVMRHPFEEGPET